MSEMEMETVKIKDIVELAHNEEISHVYSFYDGKEVFFMKGIENSFFLVWSPKIGFHICETEEAILKEYYSDGVSIRIPDLTKTRFFYQQMKNPSESCIHLFELSFQTKSIKKTETCKMGHIHTNFSKEEDSNHILSCEYMIMIQNTFAILSYYKDFGYSITNKFRF